MYATNNNRQVIDDKDQKTIQTLSLSVSTQETLSKLSACLGTSKSKIVSKLIDDCAEKIGRDNLSHNVKSPRTRQSRLDVVKYTIISRLYDAAEGCNFTYKEFSRLMSDPPISLIRERTIQEYMDKLISLGYIEKVEDNARVAYQPRKNGYQPYSLFKLSDSVVKAHGKLEGLQ